MGFQHGLSGLNAAAKNLDVIGHNVANANTVGAKSTRVEFADRYAAAVSGGGTFAGLGVAINDVSQSFSQGDLTSTNNPLDLAINGSGFFQLNSNSTGTSYTRNGQFKLDKDGFVVTSQGDRLAGYPVDGQGQVQIGVPTDLRVSTGDLAPKLSTSMDVDINLDARGEVPANAFDLSDPQTYNSATSLNLFDEQGRDTTLALYFSKTADNTWDVYGAADGAAIGAAPVASITFAADGTVDTGATAVPTTVAVPTESGGTINVDMNLGAMTQFGSAFGVNALRQDGYATGKLAGYGIDNDGVIMSRYSNGETRAQGQIALANFASPQGLTANGGNGWIESAKSGPALSGTPGSAALGTVQAGALEQSNVDLTGELVNMIMAQRSYQANAQTIRAQDQIVQTVINLR
jgi:flagellar hook protein FlgE